MDNTLQTFFKLSMKFLTPLHLQETYQFIVVEGIKLANADQGSILLIQDDKLKRVYASDPVFYKIKPRKSDFTYQTIKTQKPIIFDSKLNPSRHRIFKESNFRSGIILPLTNQNHPIGVLALTSFRNKVFTEKQMGILKLFIPLAVNAIRKAELIDESQHALEARDLFISMTAHELRTPLTTINGYAQLLYSKWANSDTQESKWVEELTSESYRLTQLINELLEINRIKTGKLHYIWTECSLLDVVNRALQDFRFTHPDNKVLLVNRLAENKDRVIGDSNKLLQVIINLLDNAAKFSLLDKKIKVTLNHKQGYIILEITDQGKGILQKDVPKVYELFYRGENQTGDGMGVGLFLAKNIITHHHGLIYIKSKKIGGTTVGIKLPEIRI